MANNPYDSSKIDDTPHFLGAWRDEDLVVVSHTGVLPDRCVGCNKRATHFRYQRIGYDEMTAKNRPRHENPLLILGATLLGIVFWLAGTYIAMHVIPVKDYPLTCIVTVIATLILVVSLIALLLRSRDPTPPIRIGLCDQHHMLRWVGDTICLVGLFGGLACIALIEFREATWLRSINLSQVGFVMATLFTVGMMLRTIQLYTFHPVVFKEDEKQHRWIKGLSKAFRESLPEWDQTMERENS